MIRYFILITLLLLFCTSALAQQNTPGKTTPPDSSLATLTKISSEIFDAGISGDKNVIEKYFTETFLETDAMGELHDKRWNLTNFLATNSKITYKIEDAQIREYGGVAVLYYKLAITYSVNIPSETEGTKGVVKIDHPNLRVTDTFVKTDGGWRIISSSRVRLPNS